MTASSPTTCRKMILLTQAELDGELDAAEAIRAAAHRADCAECQAAYRLISRSRTVAAADRSEPVRNSSLDCGKPPAYPHWQRVRASPCNDTCRGGGRGSSLEPAQR